jgi:hypothetical protein
MDTMQTAASGKEQTLTVTTDIVFISMLRTRQEKPTPPRQDTVFLIQSNLFLLLYNTTRAILFGNTTSQGRGGDH